MLVQKSLNLSLAISGGFRNYGARGQNYLRGPCLKFFVNQDYSSSSFSLKFLCLKVLFKCFPVISSQFFLRCRAPPGLPKVRSLVPWPPGSPLKLPLLAIAIVFESHLRKRCSKNTEIPLLEAKLYDSVHFTSCKIRHKI